MLDYQTAKLPRTSEADNKYNYQKWVHKRKPVLGFAVFFNYRLGTICCKYFVILSIF